MEESLVNHILNPPDFLFARCGGLVTVVKISSLKIVVLWLEVFSFYKWRWMAVEKFAL